ncbi:type II toxin-antitoxin system RelE/ParE family toxin [Vibrio sp. S11_S32]|uniref:type II toxin-antitoxin system RelE family toxin n=1 Tax=Vibrio sp. S11_S32 TaxID=2720225 RepID=UPI0016805041|nr:type II toxin-antitoxin system RelE/ParE family toxin [Vibrio sp. S11_S32]MBD1576963.1 type II toxin-antitoxin system RelE/ParE family toxin [Vibrio sp. S11_S32]
MTYKLRFKVEAEKEWRKLDSNVKAQFKKKLIERLVIPHVISDKLSGLPQCYKIKLRAAGYRLVYQVRDNELLISVIAVGKRERAQVYKNAIKRI